MLDTDSLVGALAVGLALIVGAAIVLSLVFAIVERSSRAARAPKSGTIIPRWERPAGVDLLECASVASRGRAGVAAALVDLAVRGHLRITAGARAEGGPAAAPTTLELLRTEGLSPLELRLVGTVFPHPVAGQTRAIESSAPRARVTPLTRIIEAARRSTVDRGLRFARPGAGSTRLAGVLVVGAVAAAVLLIATRGELAAVLLPIAAFIVRGVVRRLARPVGDALTPDGRRLLDHLEGMRLYLTVAEEDRIRMLQSPDGAERVRIDDERSLVKLYERLLPFAVLWGVERDWVDTIRLRFPRRASAGTTAAPAARTRGSRRASCTATW